MAATSSSVRGAVQSIMFQDQTRETWRKELSQMGRTQIAHSQILLQMLLIRARRDYHSSLCANPEKDDLCRGDSKSRSSCFDRCIDRSAWIISYRAVRGRRWVKFENVKRWRIDTHKTAVRLRDDALFSVIFEQRRVLCDIVWVKGDLLTGRKMIRIGQSQTCAKQINYLVNSRLNSGCLK